MAVRIGSADRTVVVGGGDARSLAVGSTLVLDATASGLPQYVRAVADWDEEGGSATITAETRGGSDGATVAGLSKFGLVVPIEITGLGADIKSGDTLEITMLAERDDGTDDTIRMYVIDPPWVDYNTDADYQGVTFEGTDGSWVGDFKGLWDPFAKPVSVTSTNVSGALNRLVITLDFESGVGTGVRDLLIGFAPDTSSTTWFWAIEDVTFTAA